MRYLKSYKLFESLASDHRDAQEIKADIEDILLELTDYQIEYNVKAVKYYKDGINGEDCLSVYIKDNQDRFFRLEDIMDVLLRIKDYLKDSDYSIDLGMLNADGYLDIDDFMKEFSGEELYNLNIFIYNNPRISPFKRKYTIDKDIFEARFVEFREVISTIKDICQEFEDNNCHCEITPEKNDIHLNIVSLKSRGHLSSIKQPFYLEINIDRRIIKQDEKRSGFGPFPEWFIETCRRIEDYMSSEGFKTLVSIKYPVDWENLDAIDNLSEVIGMIQKVKLEFIPNEVSKEI
jgi:hypothetical protein